MPFSREIIPKPKCKIYKRYPEGKWQTGGILKGAYQPSLLFVDGSGRLNVIQNSQTKPITHLRATDDEGMRNFAPVATGNGLPDGRGWYIGTGIHNDTMYMSYITLDYDLFLTWKRLQDTSWAPAVMLHKGSVNAKSGNHSWTRPDFQFDDRRGYLVVNETNDGSVKNSYNAVHMISFDLADPHQFRTEEIARVPQGFGAYSPDFVVTPEGWMHCVVKWGNRIYDSVSTLEGDPGVYVFSRASGGDQLDFTTSVQHADRLWHRVGQERIGAGRSGSSGRGKEASSRLCRSVDHGTTWSQVAAQNTSGAVFGSDASPVCQQRKQLGGEEWKRWDIPGQLGETKENKNPRYGIYILQVNEQ